MAVLNATWFSAFMLEFTAVDKRVGSLCLQVGEWVLMVVAVAQSTNPFWSPWDLYRKWGLCYGTSVLMWSTESMTWRGVIGRNLREKVMMLDRPGRPCIMWNCRELLVSHL